MSESRTSDILTATDGDVWLVTRLQRFRVSSTAVGMVCRPWEAMMKWPFAQEGHGSNKEPREIEMLDDDPSALEIILNIAHLRFEAVPQSLGFEQLLSLATLTDKYQATRVLRPWISLWMMDISRFVGKPGYEECAWIAWEFGLEVDFERIVTHLILNAKTDKEGRCLVDDECLIGKQLPSGMIGQFFGSCRSPVLT